MYFPFVLYYIKHPEKCKRPYPNRQQISERQLSPVSGKDATVRNVPHSSAFVRFASLFLFLLNVFQTVKCYCHKDDNSGEYELQVCIDTKDGQGISKCGKDNDTDYDA